jgi:hypothetical protein
MDRKCQHAIEALEISGNYLKCQKCNLLVPMVGKFPRPHSDRIAVSERSDMLKDIMIIVLTKKELKKNLQTC